jgi:hypothetical protein
MDAERRRIWFEAIGAGLSVDSGGSPSAGQVPGWSRRPNCDSLEVMQQVHRVEARATVHETPDAELCIKTSLSTSMPSGVLSTSSGVS